MAPHVRWNGVGHRGPRAEDAKAHGDRPGRLDASPGASDAAENGHHWEEKSTSHAGCRKHPGARGTNRRGLLQGSRPLQRSGRDEVVYKNGSEARRNQWPWYALSSSAMSILCIAIMAVMTRSAFCWSLSMSICGSTLGS